MICIVRNVECGRMVLELNRGGCVARPFQLALTLSRYLSRISSPQLAHTFFPVDGTEEEEDVGEHTDGVDGGLGDERGSSFSMFDLCDSPSECDCNLNIEVALLDQIATKNRLLLPLTCSCLNLD